MAISSEAMDLADPPLACLPLPNVNPALGAVRWSCLLSRSNLWCGDIWADYAMSEAQLIERSWFLYTHHNGAPILILSHGTWAHEIDFDTMTQTNLDSQSARPIRRIVINSD